MKYKSIEEQVAAHEGYRHKPYRCTNNKLTIGYGRNIESVGISMSEARVLLRNDIDDCVNDCFAIFSNFEVFSRSRKWALIDMRFNLGYSGFRRFRKMIAAIHAGDWETAAKDSNWFHQVGLRGPYIVSLLKQDK